MTMVFMVIGEFLGPTVTLLGRNMGPSCSVHVPEFLQKGEVPVGVGNTEFIKKALAGGATALAAVGGISSCPSQQPQLVQPLRRLRPAMAREALWLGWSPLADQAETGHPRSPGDTPLCQR